MEFIYIQKLGVCSIVINNFILYTFWCSELLNKYKFIHYLYAVFIYFQILRVQSPEGTKRIEILPSDTISQLYEKVKIVRDVLAFINMHYRTIQMKLISDISYIGLRSLRFK